MSQPQMHAAYTILDVSLVATLQCSAWACLTRREGREGHEVVRGGAEGGRGVCERPSRSRRYEALPHLDCVRDGAASYLGALRAPSPHQGHWPGRPKSSCWLWDRKSGRFLANARPWRQAAPYTVKQNVQCGHGLREGELDPQKQVE